MSKSVFFDCFPTSVYRVLGCFRSVQALRRTASAAHGPHGCGAPRCAPPCHAPAGELGLGGVSSSHLLVQCTSLKTPPTWVHITKSKNTSGRSCRWTWAFDARSSSAASSARFCSEPCALFRDRCCVSRPAVLSEVSSCASSVQRACRFSATT